MSEIESELILADGLHRFVVIINLLFEQTASDSRSNISSAPATNGSNGSTPTHEATTPRFAPPPIRLPTSRRKRRTCGVAALSIRHTSMRIVSCSVSAPSADNTRRCCANRRRSFSRGGVAWWFDVSSGPIDRRRKARRVAAAKPRSRDIVYA